jgi:predicted Zn-dependent protease
VPARLLIRGAVVLLCAAGIVVSVIARDSRETQANVFVAFFHSHDAAAALRMLHDAKALNPDSSIAIAEARLTKGPGYVTILQQAVDREPQNAVLWVRLAQHQANRGDKLGAQESYRRATQLDLELPKAGPPPGD